MTDTITLTKQVLDNLIKATEGLMDWQVKNFKVWHNGAFACDWHCMKHIKKDSA